MSEYVSSCHTLESRDLSLLRECQARHAVNTGFDRFGVRGGEVHWYCIVFTSLPHHCSREASHRDTSFETRRAGLGSSFDVRALGWSPKDGAGQHTSSLN